MITILIYEARVSLLNDFVNHKKNFNRKQHRVPLLDASIHQHLVKDIPKELRYDRPDILHFGLLTILSYLPALNNESVKIYFSVKGNIYEVLPETRLPRAQQRFYNIISQVLQGTYKLKFIRKVTTTYDELLIGERIYFTKSGQQSLTKAKDLFSFDKDYSLIFGGHAHGTTEIKEFNIHKTVKLSEQSLTLWTSISLVFCKFLH